MISADLSDVVATDFVLADHLDMLRMYKSKFKTTSTVNSKWEGGIRRGGSLDPRWEMTVPRTASIRNQTYNRTSTRGVLLTTPLLHA